MRYYLKKHGDKDSHDTLACCWQPQNFLEVGCIAELHFCLEHLSHEIIAHECVHAAWHRSVILGYPRDHEELQEMLAEGTGVIVSRVNEELKKLKIRIKD
jgi:hypothetical protein